MKTENTQGEIPFLRRKCIRPYGKFEQKICRFKRFLFQTAFWRSQLRALYYSEQEEGYTDK